MSHGLMTFARRIGRRAKRLLRREEGTATMEFVIMFPVFMTLFLSSFELAILMTRQAFLERAVDMTVRDLRLGTWPNLDADLLKSEICSHLGTLISNCSSELMLELTPVNRASWSLPNPAATCVNRGADVQPVVTFTAGTQNELMIVRACAMVDPVFPGTALALLLEENVGDGFPLIATSGFVNEPGTGT
jgi:hypothetical protein